MTNQKDGHNLESRAQRPKALMQVASRLVGPLLPLRVPKVPLTYPPKRHLSPKPALLAAVVFPPTANATPGCPRFTPEFSSTLMPSFVAVREGWGKQALY